MPSQTLFSKSISDNVRRWVTRLFVRSGWIKSSPMELAEINRMINGWLPQCYKIDIPGGQGDLQLLNLELTSVEKNDGGEQLKAIIWGNFEVKVNRAVIFSTALKLDLRADPDYSIQTKSIGICNLTLIRLSLVAGQNSFIKDVSNLANGILPTPLKGLFNVALASTTAILGDQLVNDMTKYLSIYSSGNQQRVIDYHQKDIENKLIELSQDQDIRYQLDESEFEEKIFADYGKKVAIKNGQLLFLF